MMIILQHLFELFITLMENSLFFFYISNRLSPKKNYIRNAVLGILVLSSLATLMKYLSMPSHISICLALFLEISFTFLLTKGSFAEKLFWGCSYCVIDFFSESMTFLILDIATNYNSSTLMTEYPMRYILGAVYLFLLGTIVIVFSQRAQYAITFPRWILPIFLFLAILGVFAVETLLDVIIYLDTMQDYSQNMVLYRTIWIFLFVLLFIVLLIIYLNRLYHKNMELVKEQQVQQIEKQQFELFSSTVDMLRIWKHDSTHHFSVMEELLHNEKYEDALSYIHDIHQDFERSQFGIFTGNSILDAVISAKLISIQKNNIRFSHSIFLPESLPFDHIALTSLMGNLFDNAVEACMQLENEDSRYITLTIKPHRNSLSICMENSSSGNYHFDNTGKLCSTKQEANHGIGLPRIRKIAEDVSGFCQILPEPDRFIITIVVPLEIPKEKR